MQPTILVPLDGSPEAETVLPYVIPLLQAGLGKLTLARVVPTFSQFIGFQGAAGMAVNIESYYEVEREVAQSYLAGVQTRLQAQGLALHTELLEGDPAQALLAYAAQIPNLALMALATHGRSGVGRWVFGSVAEAILHAAPAPLLLVRRPAAPPAAASRSVYRTILVALDGSPFAEEALDQAFALASVTGAALVLVGVVAPAPTGTHPAQQAAQQAATDEMQTYLARTAARLENLGLTVDTQLVHGHPAEAILATADRSGADLIVLATHGRSGWQQVRFGSVALKVVQAAHHPVGLVRAGATPAPRLGSGLSVAAPVGAGSAAL